MQQRSTPEKKCTPPYTAPWRVKHVEPLEDFRLSVEFIDGLKGIVSMKQKILDSKPGVFSELKDLDLFNQVFIELGVVTWPGGLDLAPDAMHTEIKKNGEWILK